MKLLWFIALMSAFIGNIGDCTPRITPLKRRSKENASPLKRRVSFSKMEEVFTIPSDPMGVFWLRRKNFIQKVEQAGQYYDKTSTEKKFLDNLTSVIYKNSKMFQRIWSYANIFQSYAVILCQTEISDKDGTELFPCAQELAELELDKKDFERKLIELLNLLSPSYERVEHLYHLLDCMTAETKITTILLNQLDQESAIVNQIYQQFEYLFIGFPLEAYRNNISNIRCTTNRLEDGLLRPTRASRKLVEFMDEIDEVVPKIERTLDIARAIDFTKLSTATNAFYSLASKALNT